MNSALRYPREIGVSPSRYWLLSGAAIHMVAAFAFVFLWSQPAWLLSGAVALTISAVGTAVLWHRAQGEVLVLGDDGLPRVCARGVEREAVMLSATDFGWATWLVWREEAARGSRARMLLRADFPAQEWRALGLWLRHKALIADEGPLSAA